VFGAGEWSGGRRLHQFSGDVLQTYGGDTMEVDQDYLDVALAAPGGTVQSSPAASTGVGSATIVYRGSDGRLWAESSTPAGQWTRVDLGGYLKSAPSVVQVGSSVLDVFYRGRHGYLWQVTRSGSHWGSARRLTQMGVLGGPPRAVAQPNGVIDVFWVGSHDDHLWHALYNPGAGWSGPQNLGGSLASWPYPVETSAGAVEVFWKGVDGNLWQVVRGLGQTWTAPADLGMGELGGAPHAVALADGEIDVFWRGFTSPHGIWSAELIPGHGVVGPLSRGGTIVGQPWPVVGAGAERVMFRGPNGHFWLLVRNAQGQWAGPVELASMGHLSSAPVAAAGSGAVQVFWTGRKRRLWTVRLTEPGGWQSPQDLGGSV
jgi:hypothetical protein